MTDNVEQTQPEQPVAEPRLAETDELHELKSLLREYGPSIGIALAVVLVVGIGIGVYRSNRRSSTEQAAMMLGNARSAQDLENVVAQHASTPMAPLALLKLARAYFDGGNYDGAMAKYDELKQKHATHPLAVAADLGRIHCQEAKGQTREALQGFVAFVREHPDHFLTPQAVFGQGRCLEALGQLAEAKAVYEDFIAAHPKSGWTPRADELLEQVKRSMSRPAGAVGAVSPAGETGVPPLLSVTNLTVAPVGAP